MNKEKIEGLISTLKTSNEVVKKQIEIQQRTIDLIGDLITEPESIALDKQSDFVQACVWWATLPRETMLSFRKLYCNTQTGLVSDDKIQEIWRKETQQGEPTNIKPEDMKAGEWYVLGSKNKHISKFNKLVNNKVYVFKDYCFEFDLIRTDKDIYALKENIKSLRPATREEVTRYFPNEFEIPTHGGNDIPQVTDEQL